MGEVAARDGMCSGSRAMTSTSWVLAALAACFLFVPVLAWIRRWREEREWRRLVARPRGPVAHLCMMDDGSLKSFSEDDPAFDPSRKVIFTTRSGMAVTKGDGGDPRDEWKGKSND